MLEHHPPTRVGDPDEDAVLARTAIRNEQKTLGPPRNKKIEIVLDERAGCITTRPL